MFAGKKSAQIREILISESAWEEMTCLFAPSLNKIVFSFNFLNQQDIDACTQNRNTLYALYAKSMAVILYFAIAVFSISKMFIYSLKWNESSAYGVGVCLALLLTILLTNVIGDSRERLGNLKFYFRLIQMVVFVLSFFGFSQLYASNGMTIKQQQNEHIKNNSRSTC